MTTVIVVLSLTVLLLTGNLAGLAVWARRRVLTAENRAAELADQLAGSGYRALVDRQVVANTNEGVSIRGVLVAVYDDSLVIRHPQYVGAARPADIGDEVTLSRSAVPMLQRFESEGEAA